MTWPSGGDPNQPYGGPPQPPNQYPPPPAYQQPYPQPGPPPPPPPPPMPYDPGRYGEAPPLPPYASPPKKSKKGLFIALAVIAVLLVAAVVTVGFLVVSKLDDTTIATEMKLGDCITEIPTDSRVLTLPTVDCAEPHGGEVFAVITMPDGDYPGQTKIDQTQNQCPEKLATFSPDAMTDDSVGIYVLYPTPETWDRGDRTVTCIATLDPKRAGSLKG